jgi:methionyl-tRNA formyltransferase
MRLALLSSGKLGYETCKEILQKKEVSFIMSDKNSIDIIKLAKDYNVELFIGNPRSELAAKFIVDKTVDVLISINYLFIINQNLINAANILAFNIHGSLLPKYRGRTPHVWAIINNEKETGITAHKIDKNCDTGDIIKQIRVEIEAEDTGGSILAKYLDLYVPLIESVLEDVAANKIRASKQNNSMATYFGKRTPDDGQINWEWQLNRIINWIRAQAYPYPGAFTFCNEEKIIIDKVIKSDFGFDYNQQNGTILSTEPLTVKCSNSAVEIVEFRYEYSPEFVVNKKLH